MKAKTAFAIVIVSAAVAANLIMAGCAPIRYPSCGSYIKRATDGNWCQECIDPHGNYARCRSSEPLP